MKRPEQVQHGGSNQHQAKQIWHQSWQLHFLAAYDLESTYCPTKEYKNSHLREIHTYR